MMRRPPESTLFPKPTLFRSGRIGVKVWIYKGDASGSRAEREALEALAARQQRRERSQRPRRSGSSGTTAGGTEAGRAAAESSTGPAVDTTDSAVAATSGEVAAQQRSEEHTSELQSRQYLVCRLLLEKKT